MTQQDLANHLGVSRQAISRWEMMTSEPSTENLLKIKELFHIPLDALLLDNGPDDPNDFMIQATPLQEDTTAKVSSRPQRPLRFNRHIYLALALIVWIYSKVLIAVYPRSISILTDTWVIRAIGPLFSFFLILYLTLSTFHYADKWCPRYRRILHPLLMLCLLLTWLFLCSKLRPDPLIMSGGAFALPAIACAAMLYFMKQRKEG